MYRYAEDERGTYSNTTFVDWWIWATRGGEVDDMLGGDDVVRMSSFGEVPTLFISLLLSRSTTNMQRSLTVPSPRRVLLAEVKTKRTRFWAIV